MEDKEFEQRISDGYNNGYLLSRFEPTLYKQLTNNCDKEQPYFKGMIEGHRVHEQEIFLKGLQHSKQMQEQSKPRMK